MLNGILTCRERRQTYHPVHTLNSRITIRIIDVLVWQLMNAQVAPRCPIRSKRMMKSRWSWCPSTTEASESERATVRIWSNDIPIKNTFVHFSLQNYGRRRSLSCDGRYYTGVTDAQVGDQHGTHLRHEPIRIPGGTKQKRHHESDAVVLREYAAHVRAERWELLVMRTLELNRPHTISKATTGRLRGNFKAHCTRTKLRHSVPLRIYPDIAEQLFASNREPMLLERLGTLRRRRSCIELWCSDQLLHDPTMKTIVDVMAFFERLTQTRSMWVIVDHTITIVMPCAMVSSPNDLSTKVANKLGKPDMAFEVSSRGRILTDARLLLQRVGPGSVVRLKSRSDDSHDTDATPKQPG